MSNSSQQPYRAYYQDPARREHHDQARMRKEHDERCAAVRRWIDEDNDTNETACRGID